MARLTDEQALTVLKSPVNKTYIYQACKHEERLTLHTAPIMHVGNMPAAYHDFLRWVEAILVPDKFKRFLQVLTFPLDTVDSTKAIFDELSKVFDAQDQLKKYDFTAPEIADDFLNYLSTIHDSDFWKTKGFDALKNKINSILIIDVKAQQTTLRPEPYYYLLNIKNVIDIEYNEKTEVIEYIAFKESDTKAYVFDDEFFRVYTKPNQKDWVLEIANAHSTYSQRGELIDGLGYCPATPFYRPSIDGSRLVDKRGPITDVLGKLDWLQFVRTSYRYFQLYGAWPIIVSYEEKCAYRDAKGNECQDGKIYDFVKQNGTEVELTKDCPACNARQLLGPGSQWTVKPPAREGSFNPMETPVKVVEISSDSLEYWVKHIPQLEDEIYLNCVGFDGDAMNNQAINKNQVAANFESKESILDRIKEQLEKTEKFAKDTIARLRYGRYFIKSVIDYGNEYFLKSVDHLVKHLQEARANGLPVHYQAYIREKIIQTQTRNNPDQQQRDAILSELEPYPDLSLSDLNTLGIREEDPISYLIKLNFTAYIKRFERENINIVEFGSLIPFNQKISIISQKLKEYGTEQQRQKAASAQQNPGGNEGIA